MPGWWIDGHGARARGCLLWPGGLAYVLPLGARAHARIPLTADSGLLVDGFAFASAMPTAPCSPAGLVGNPRPPVREAHREPPPAAHPACCCWPRAVIGRALIRTWWRPPSSARASPRASCSVPPPPPTRSRAASPTTGRSGRPALRRRPPPRPPRTSVRGRPPTRGTASTPTWDCCASWARTPTGSASSGAAWSRRRGTFDTEAPSTRYRAGCSPCAPRASRPWSRSTTSPCPPGSARRAAGRATPPPRTSWPSRARVTARWGARSIWWCTINEPNVYAVNGYLKGEWPPGKSDQVASADGPGPPPRGPREGGRGPPRGGHGRCRR